MDSKYTTFFASIRNLIKFFFNQSIYGKNLYETIARSFSDILAEISCLYH